MSAEYRIINDADASLEEDERLRGLLATAFPELSAYEHKRNLYEAPEWRVLVEEGGCVIGTAAVRRLKLACIGVSMDALGIGDLCVEEAHRGKGHARRMMELIMEHCRKLKAGFLVLFGEMDVYERYGFKPAFNFYKKLDAFPAPLQRTLIWECGEQKWPNEDVKLLGEFF